MYLVKLSTRRGLILSELDLEYNTYLIQLIQV